MNRIVLLVIMVLGVHNAKAQDLKAFNIFTSSGIASNWSDLIEKASNSDVVFFGEQHNDPVSHWLELKLAESLFKIKENHLVLGAEMFESDNQRTIDEYLSGIIVQKNFESEMRLWPNYKTDYKPLLEFAVDNKLPFVATNIPRRYANLVYRKGFEGLESLSKDAKKDIAPAPIAYDATLPGYKAMMEGMDPGHVSENLPKAQAVKDATMAYFISENMRKNGCFIHYNGAYHSDNKEGILWYLQKLKPKAKLFTISVVSQESIDKLDNSYFNKADFIIVVPEDFTKTY